MTADPVDPADPADALRERRLRVTPQRRAILGAFRNRIDEHLSADEVHARASRMVPELGRGTVYATLAELTELGLLGAVGTPEPVRYELHVAPHDHFRCRLCLRLFDLDLGAGGLVMERPLPAGFLLERISASAEGVCGPCRAFRRGAEAGADAVTRERRLDDEAVGSLACDRRGGPLGEIVLAASADGAVRLAFPEHADYGALVARARSRRGARPARRHAADIADGLERYFGGSLDPCQGIVDWRWVEEESAGALEATREIPYGDSCSYERLSDELEPFACGRALGANPLPLLLPCHRVGRGGEPAEVWVGGGERLAQLLRFEADTLASG